MRAVPSFVCVLSGATLVIGCGGEAAAPPPRTASTTDAFTTEGASPADRWGTFRSKRFNLVLRLPGGSEWRIDDRSRPELVALHAATHSRIVAARWSESSPQNRESCVTTARQRGLAPPASARVVDDASELRPTGEDVRSWIALEPGADASGPVRGHATLVGAHLKKCFAVSYVTEVASMKDEAELTTRLAVVREGTLARVRIEPFDDVPRERNR